MQRRDVLKSGMAVGAALVCAGAGTIGDAEQDNFAFLDELESLAAPATRSEINSKGYNIDFRRIPTAWDEISRSQLVVAAKKNRALYDTLRPEQKPRWPALTRAPDYAHLARYRLDEPHFELSADTLRFAMARNRFKKGSGAQHADRVIFALRGCAIADGSTAKPWASRHSLVETRPNHLKTNCVAGVWRTSDDKISVYRSSTVADGLDMFGALQYEGLGASLLPTGLYRYRPGVHNMSKPLSRQQPGALLIQDRYAVLRTAKDLEYDPYSKTTAWTLGAAHNIHSSGSVNSIDRFYSAGCQVVCGFYQTAGKRRIPVGNWAQFEADAGLISSSGDPVISGHVIYQLMLLTGYELALAHHAPKEFVDTYFRLRPGSEGADVMSLQNRLLRGQNNRDGYFGVDTTFAVLDKHKADVGEYASHVFVG